MARYLCLWWGPQKAFSSCTCAVLHNCRDIYLKKKTNKNKLKVIYVNVESFKRNGIFLPLNCKRGSVLNVNKLCRDGKERASFPCCVEIKRLQFWKIPQPSCIFRSSTAMGLQHHLSVIKILRGSVIFLFSWWSSTLRSPTPLVTHSHPCVYCTFLISVQSKYNVSRTKKKKCSWYY